MRTVLLKTNLQKTRRYRLFEVNGSSVQQLASESTLPGIISEINRLDNPEVITDLSDLVLDRDIVFDANPKLLELDSSEKNRYKKYCKRK